MSKITYADIIELPLSHSYKSREIDVDPSYAHLYSAGSVLIDKKVLVENLNSYGNFANKIYEKPTPPATYNGYLSDPDDDILDETAKHEYLLKKAHELNSKLPRNSQEYWIVKGGKLDKVPVKEMIEICNIDRNMSSFGV